MRFFVSQETEVERVINILAVTMTGFFERTNFVVVPELTGGTDETIQVVLPSLNYQSIPGLWHRLQILSRDIPVEIEQQWRDKLDKIMKPYDQKCDDFCLQLQKEWSEIEEVFFAELERDFPRIRQKIGEIEVRVSEYGTISSGTWGSGEGKRNMYFYLRSDRGLSDLASMMINLILLEKKEELGITWSKREALMDYIMTRPAMKKLFPQYRPVMSQLLLVKSDVRLSASRYLNSLGIPRLVKEIDVDRGKIVVKGNIVGNELGEKEIVLLKTLVKHEGEVVNYDTLADVLWGEGEFKSYWAINKLVERVRNKLMRMGVDMSRLKSVRGQGYLWESNRVNT